MYTIKLTLSQVHQIKLGIYFWNATSLWVAFKTIKKKLYTYTYLKYFQWPKDFN